MSSHIHRRAFETDTFPELWREYQSFLKDLNIMITLANYVTNYAKMSIICIHRYSGQHLHSMTQKHMAPKLIINTYNYCLCCVSSQQTSHYIKIHIKLIILCLFHLTLLRFCQCHNILHFIVFVYIS
jgi:hypothetical protein